MRTLWWSLVRWESRFAHLDHLMWMSKNSGLKTILFGKVRDRWPWTFGLWISASAEYFHSNHLWIFSPCILFVLTPYSPTSSVLGGRGVLCIVIGTFQMIAAKICLPEQFRATETQAWASFHCIIIKKVLYKNLILAYCTSPFWKLWTVAFCTITFLRADMLFSID